MAKKTKFTPPTTYAGAMDMVSALDPDSDTSTKDKYVAWERLKLFFRLILSTE